MPEPKTQSDKFKEAARELGCDDDEARWDATLKKVAKQKPAPGEARGRMTLRCYLLIVFLLAIAGLIVLIAAAWEPESWAPGWEWRMLFGIPFLAGFVALALRRFAVQVRESDRVSFWSYRAPNLMLAGLGAVIVFSYIWVTLWK